MSLIKLISKDIFISFCLLLLFTFSYQYLIELGVLFSKNGSDSLLNLRKPNTVPGYSSVFCRGNNHTDRLCFFKNLCLDPVSTTFVFFKSSKSIQSGLPSDRFSPALADFSSVSDHNTLYFNYAELPYSSITKFNISSIIGHGLMFKRFNPDNLMHVFHDDLIPAYATLQELNKINLSEVFLVFADGRNPGPYKKLYEYFLPKQPIYTFSLSSDYLHCFDTLYVGLNKASTWYQYGFKKPQGPLPKSSLTIAPVIHNFRDYFFSRFSISFPKQDSYAALFVRKHNRKILNVNEVTKTITSRTGLKVILVSLDDSSIIDIIQIVSQCQIVVGMHGSMLILSLFLPLLSIVYELFPYNIHSNISTPYKTMCDVAGLNLLYQTWENKIEKHSYPHSEYLPELGGTQHLSLSEQERIKNSDLKPFLCCEDPVWLYRIYQDTVVDPESFGVALQKVHNKQQKLINDDMGNIINENLFVFPPSEVQNISCRIFEKNRTLVLTWNIPWTLHFMDKKNVEYEIWIQEVETENVQAFLVKKMYFSYLIEPTNNYYAWIRCYMDGQIGPFSSSIIC